MDSEIKDKITKRLASIGYTYVEATDAFALELTYKKVEERILHACNIAAVPDCMEAEIIDAVCGEFLAGKKATGQLTGIETEAIVKAITEGDVKVEFATGNNTGADDIFNAFVVKLATIDPEAILAHRRLVW